MYQSPQNPNSQYPSQQQPGSFGPPRPKSTRSKQSGIRRWWRQRSLLAKIGIVCVTLPVIISLLFVGSAAAIGTYEGITQGHNTTPANTASTNAQHQIAQAVTPTPTQAPTPTPRPQPTQAPTTPPKTQPVQPPRPQPAQVIRIQPTPTPRPQPTQAPTPTPTMARTGVNGNPWGYDFNATGGMLITNPVANFCTAGYFQCINNFNNGAGYVVECQDGQFSKTGGQPKSCSKHGGDRQPLYSH